MESSSFLNQSKNIIKYYQDLQQRFNETLDKALGDRQKMSAMDLVLKVAELNVERAAAIFYGSVALLFESDENMSYLMLTMSIHHCSMDLALDGEDFDPTFVEDMFEQLLKQKNKKTKNPKKQKDAIAYFQETMAMTHIARCALEKTGISVEMISSLGNCLAHPDGKGGNDFEVRTKAIRKKRGQMKYAAVKDIKPDLKAFLERLTKPFEDPFEKAAYAVCEFTRIHPFTNNVGKVARALMNYCLQEAGYPVLIILDTLKERYESALEDYTVCDFDLEPMQALLRHAATLCWEEDVFGIISINSDFDDDDDLELNLSSLDDKDREELEGLLKLLK